MTRRKKKFGQPKRKGHQGQLQRFAIALARQKGVEYHNRSIRDIVGDLIGAPTTLDAARVWLAEQLSDIKPGGMRRESMKSVAAIEAAVGFEVAPKYRSPVTLQTGFYVSRDWREARYAALKKSDGCCMLCGRSKAAHGVVLHVDHIKPRSRYQALELDINNLQVLCDDCNIGKSNRDTTDWRGSNVVALVSGAGQ
jgi:hypothetical protein